MQMAGETRKLMPSIAMLCCMSAIALTSLVVTMADVVRDVAVDVGDGAVVVVLVTGVVVTALLGNIHLKYGLLHPKRKSVLAIY